MILVKRLPHADGLPLPQRMTPGSSGCDVAAAVEDLIIIPAGGHAIVPTGLVVEIPIGFEIQVRPRSGLAARHAVTVLNTPGTIDADYRGEIKVILINLGKEPFTIKRGDRIAQLVPMAIAASLDFKESSAVSETGRGAGGFGHTGM
ncbi:MAG: dUTP diphosphatase [Chitinispirillaceae bacterium]|jgi:dUTP pyrophosphatase|nr:dUTP diphosphatase [Chitinispirillaceae bacterium]